jgi:uncharacterized damage-inducible protein DinB
MPDTTELARAIQATVTGPVWHGESLATLLRPVSASDAAAHPIAGAHSIWELVLHIASWAGIAEQRLALEPTDEPDDEEDWPAPPRATSANWTGARAELAATHARLASAVSRLTPAALNRRVPGRNYTVCTMLHGVVEHGAYHGGQIALLTKALANRQSA